MDATWLSRREFLRRLLRAGLGLGLAGLGAGGLPGCAGPTTPSPIPGRTPTVPPPSHELRFYRPLAVTTILRQSTLLCSTPASRLLPRPGHRWLPGRSLGDSPF